VEYHTFTSEYVHRLAIGDPEVEQHFVNYFGELLLIKLRRSLRSFTAVEDVRQETFLRVFRALKRRGGLLSPEKLGAFVNGVCNNILSEHYRATARLAALPQTEVEAQTTDPDPEAGMVSEESKRSVRRLLEKLPAKDRRILHLLFIEEREKDEVCRICQVNRSYLRVLLHRAKNRFRDSLADKNNARVTSAISSFRTTAATTTC
jgi:RNA polymerase sigma-70 factor (ECF subfamily)